MESCFLSQSFRSHGVSTCLSLCYIVAGFLSLSLMVACFLSLSLSSHGVAACHSLSHIVVVCLSQSPQGQWRGFMSLTVSSVRLLSFTVFFYAIVLLAISHCLPLFLVVSHCVFQLHFVAVCHSLSPIFAGFLSLFLLVQWSS